jgi:hypothetical protein
MSTNMSGIEQSNLFSRSKKMEVIIAENSRYRILSDNLPWMDLAEVANEHRSQRVNIHNGRPLDLRAHLGAYVSQTMNGWTDRETEEMVRYHGGVRVLCGLQGSTDTIDHTAIERFRNSVGKTGAEEINQKVVEVAGRLGFTGADICSSDTTVQEAPIAYPTEVGHLRNIAEKLLGIGKKIKKGVSGKLKRVKEEVEKIFTEIRLFTRGKKEKAIEKKKKLARKLHRKVKEMFFTVAEAVSGMGEKAQKKYDEQMELYLKMIGQIKQWIETGFHPAGKLISLWTTEARAIKRNKSGKMTEFGWRWIITRLKNGYMIGRPCEKLGADADTSIAAEVLDHFKDVFGEAPNNFIYDRGGDGADNHDTLEEEGVKNNCIFRKGKEKMDVGPITFKRAKRERALSEAAIATLKSNKYGFTKPRAKSTQSCILKGQTAMIGANLNHFFRDIVKSEGLAMEIG